MPPVLYHAPPSFYSQIARLGLAEKGVDYTAKLTAAGPPLFETYRPWYMRLNPGGTVPTLVDGQTAVPDSREILHYVDANFDGPPLIPSAQAQGAEMERLIDALYEVSIRELSYGSARMVKIGARLNGKRAAKLRKLAVKNPDMREIYEAKLRDIESFTAGAQDAEGVAAQLQRMQALLDELDAKLGTQPFVVGSDYSLADVVATVTIARLLMLGHDPLSGRAALAAWFARMRERPSYERADIWDHFKRSRIAGMIARKLGPYLLLVLVLIAVVVWLLSRLW